MACLMLLEGSWRWQRCCCFTVKTGTSIIAILRLIFNIINFLAVCALPNSVDGAEVTAAEKYFLQVMPLALTPGTKALFGIIALIDIILFSLLLHGNFKNIARIMKPAVYWWLACIIFNTIITIVGIAQVASVEAAYIAPLVIGLLISWVLSLWLLQVIRCRIADVEEAEVR